MHAYKQLRFLVVGAVNICFAYRTSLKNHSVRDSKEEKSYGTLFSLFVLAEFLVQPTLQLWLGKADATDSEYLK